MSSALTVMFLRSGECPRRESNKRQVCVQLLSRTKRGNTEHGFHHGWDLLPAPTLHNIDMRSSLRTLLIEIEKNQMG